MRCHALFIGMAQSQPNGGIHLYVGPEHNQKLQFGVLEKIPNFMAVQSICSFEPTAPTPAKQNPLVFSCT